MEKSGKANDFPMKKLVKILKDVVKFSFSFEQPYLQNPVKT